MKKLLSVILALVISSVAFSQNTTNHVGHWRCEFAGASIGDLYFSENGTFRWLITYTPKDAEKRIIDSDGKYRITEDRLELFYSDRPEHAQKWRFKVEGDIFWLIDKYGGEKISYKRVVEEKTKEPNQRPERNAGATSSSTSTPPPGAAHP